jgi:adenine phosphoribosyltransferase
MENIEERMEDIKKYIREVPDWPKKGVSFKDITTLLKNNDAYKKAVDILCQRYKDKKIDKVVCIEARGFILGGAIAHNIGAGVVPVRKKGKLPHKTHAVTYDLEYGTDTLEIHQDAIEPGERVLIVDDVLATGGTMKAVAELVEKLKGEIVEVAFWFELTFLHGRDKLKGYPLFVVSKY